MKKSRIFAFTVAEIMIVVTVIGILSAILLPMMFHSTPDKNIIKYKKFHKEFVSAIGEISSNDAYFVSGDLNRKPDGTDTPANNTDANERNYFINSLADVIAHREIEYTTRTDTDYNALFSAISTLPDNELNIFIESFCASHIGNNGSVHNVFNRIRTNDGIDIYEFAPGEKYINSVDDNGFDNSYKIICVDIDGEENEVRYFGYGIRKDGKIIYGPRTTWWLDRDIVKKDDDCCPTTVSQVAITLMGIRSKTISHCDEKDTICPAE